VNVENPTDLGQRQESLCVFHGRNGTRRLSGGHRQNGGYSVGSESRTPLVTFDGARFDAETLGQLDASLGPRPPRLGQDSDGAPHKLRVEPEGVRMTLKLRARIVAPTLA